jgi:hypothetical protein
MIQDLDFLDTCASAETIVGAAASTSTSVSIGVGPGYAAGGADAYASGRNGTSTDTGTLTLASPAAGRAIAWADAVSRDGSNSSHSSSRASGYSNGEMQIIHYTSGQR